MFAFINQYMSYIVLALVLGVGGYMYVQSNRIDSLKLTVDAQQQTIANQANELKSIKSDVLGLQTLDSNRKDNRAELQALKDKVGKLSEPEAKKDTAAAEKQINATVNQLLSDISGATK
ncbi:hypothetical protein KNT87_gp183 [Erwinia phage Cronus]|uniref:I-spanin n=1 Tax=Erwinia phage Cronus TaxID=2163633 RepID=A0A2S1GLX7_9CAUD|nr:hypothetical protein KNT87_gp183 [Erwinia phage Cronus]AWD90386.1 hypothetical protein [Erwinia phage Cronus]